MDENQDFRFDSLISRILTSSRWLEKLISQNTSYNQISVKSGKWLSSSRILTSSHWLEKLVSQNTSYNQISVKSGKWISSYSYVKSKPMHQYWLQRLNYVMGVTGNGFGMTEGRQTPMINRVKAWIMKLDWSESWSNTEIPGTKFESTNLS